MIQVELQIDSAKCSEEAMERECIKCPVLLDAYQAACKRVPNTKHTVNTGLIKEWNSPTNQQSYC